MKPKIPVPIDIKKLNIPFISIPDGPIVATALDHLPIAEIVDDLILYKDGGAAIILESTSLNFGLLSEREQEAVISAYAALLNSLSFSIQVVVRSQRKDISSYLTYLEETFKKATNPKIIELMGSYQNFINETVKKKNILGKRFFVVLMFSALELGTTKSFLASTKRKGPLPFSKDYIIKKAKLVLYPRKDHLMRQAGRLGLKLKQLEKSQIVELLYEIYNPKVTSIQTKEEIQADFEKNEANK